jgi:hypothetical protein
MGFFEKIKKKFHKDADNHNRLLTTENNKQQFGVPTDDEPRNRMMDTVSNQQGAEYAAKETNPNETVTDKLEVNKNNLFNTLSNEDADKVSQGVDITKEHAEPRNKLLDVEPNSNNLDNTIISGDVPLNSNRVK